jgi:hypothetical protein
MRFVVVLSVADFPIQSTRTKLLTATPSLLVVCPITRVVTFGRLPTRPRRAYPTGRGARRGETRLGVTTLVTRLLPRRSRFKRKVLLVRRRD